jgi:hypothetical protein
MAALRGFAIGQWRVIVVLLGRPNRLLEFLPTSSLTTAVKALRRQLAINGLHDAGVGITVRRIERALSQNENCTIFTVGL